jgi:hypothetical protein
MQPRKHKVMLLDRVAPFCKDRGIQLISAFDDAAVVEECFLSFKNPNPSQQPAGTVIDKPLSDRTRANELDRYRSFPPLLQRTWSEVQTKNGHKFWFYTGSQQQKFEMRPCAGCTSAECHLFGGLDFLFILRPS